MAQNPWGVVSQEPLKNPWAIVSETSLEPPAEKDKPAEQPQPAILSPEEIGDPEAALIQGGRPVERPVSQAPQAVVAPTEQQIGAGMEQQLRPWEPSVWERIQGMFPGDRAKAANEYAARQIAKERNIPVEEAYRQMKSAIGVSGAFGGRPSGQPMWNPEGRPEVQATTQAAPYLAEGLLNIPKGVAESALRAYRAGDIESSVDSGLVDKMITYLGDDSKYIFIPNIPEKLGLDKKDPNYQSLAGLGNSLGYSLTTMVSSAVSASLAAPAGPVAQVAAGMGASGAVAYRASKDDFLNRLRDKLNKDSKKVFGRPMTDEEWGEAKEKFNAEAVKYGAWEAIPEAISNAIFLKAFAAPAKAASGGRLSGIIEKSASVASEHITETATGYGQNAQELKADLTQNELTIVDAFKQQFIQTMLTMGVMAGGAKGVQAANQFYETQVLPRIDPASALAKAIKADLEFAGYSPAAFRMKSVTDAEKELLQQVPVKPITGQEPILPDAQTAVSAKPEPTLDVEALPVDTERKEPTLGPRQPVQPAPIVSPEMVPGMTEESEFEPLAVPPEEEVAQEEAAPAPTQAAAALPDTPTVAPAQKQKIIKEPPPPPRADEPESVRLPVEDLKLSKEVPQWKVGATEKGVVEPLGGKFTQEGVAPIAVWKRLDGSLEVISGRHRFDLAQRSGTKFINAEVYNEADGFTAKDAAIKDAELNIRDEQGKVKDYVNYFKQKGISREDASSKGFLAREKGKKSFTIAEQGSDELISAINNDQVNDQAAYYIALNAPNDAKLQAVGIRAVMDGKSANAATNMMQAVKALAYENNTTTDMFGYDHSAEKEAQAMANIAARKQREMQTRLNAITGAVKNPKLAAEEGIDIKDPEAVRQRVIELRQRKAEWDNWSTNPELIAEIRAERGTAAPQLELRGETEQEIRQREATQDAERQAAEEKAIADREVDMFGLQPQVQEKEEAPTEDMFGAEGITQQPPKAPAPPTETGLFAAPKEEKKAEPKIGQVVKRIQLPNNMEARVFKTSDGYGASLYDKESNNNVDGSVTRYKGEDALERATKKAEEIGKPKAPEESAEIKLARKELEESKKEPGKIIKGAKLRRRRLLLEHDKKREAAGKEPEVDVISELEKAGNEAVNNKPTKPDTPAKQRLVLMPCCDKKAAKAAPAMDLYKGVFFQTFANNVPAGADPNVVILSAKYGFISPDKVIEPYDQVMTGERAREMLSDLDKQLSEVKWPGDISDVLIVGGKEYQRVMRAAVAKLIEQGKISKDASVNVTKGGIGDQRSQLGAYLRDIPAQEEVKETTTAEQRKNAQDNADDIGGEVVWMQGDYALVRGYSLLSGDPVYVGTKGSSRGRVDIESFTGDAIPADVKATMIAEKKRIEAEDKKKHEQKPFIVFDEGVALSEDIPPELAGVIREWKDLLKLNVPVYVSTIEDAKSNRNKFTGPHRRIGSGTLDANEAGSMRRMSDGSYYILFQKSAKPTKMLEVIAHEMGHLHQRVYYENASPVEKEALQAAHLKWLEGQKGKTAKELVEALRGRAVAKETRMPEGKSAEELSSYWKSFGEWYADQTSRWAVSAERPVTVVEKFFKRLGNQLRQFYQKLKNAKYLPDETFKEYIERATSTPANLEPGKSDIDKAERSQIGFNFDDEKKITDEVAKANPVVAKALHEADQLPNAKKKLPPGRSPELAAAAQMVKDGRMTAAEYDKLVNKYKPIPVYTQPLVPATEQEVVNALDASKRDKVNPRIANYHPVGLRLDIPAFNRHGVFVVSIHEKRSGASPGKVIGYASVASVKDATFGIGNQKAALKIATGEAKDALQTIEGKYSQISPEDAYRKAKEAISSGTWVQIGIDPTRHSYFYDRKTTLPVIKAEEVLQIGNMVLGRGVTYGRKEDFLYNIELPTTKSAAFQEASAAQDRDDLISQLQSAKQELAAIPAKVARGESSIYLQKRANKLIGLARNLREQIDATKDRRDTPEDFLARAAKALADGQIEPSVYNVIKVAFEKEPSLLDGLLLSVKKGPEKSTAGSFAAFDRIVSLYTGTSGTTSPSTIRHELAHSLEQMMTGAQREAVIQKYTRELQKAIKSHPEDVYQNYFKAVLAFLEKPTQVNLQKAMRLVPSYDMYQYINPSEYWAVNAESLMASQLGGTWEKFKAAVRRLFEGLKSVFGFDNQYAIHKTFNDIMKGSRERLNYDVLADYVNKRIGEEVEVEPLILSNIQDDKDLLEKYKRPNTPMTDLTPVSTFVNNQWKNGKELYKEFVNDPKQAIADSGSAAARATLYLRNKGVFYGAGLESSDFARYNGALKTSEGLATASLALDNAIASGNIGIEVIFSGGLRYNPNAGRFVAEDRDQGMRGVYEAQYKLENRIGRQLATDIIQGYLEAKRSISIMNELYEREAAYEGVKQDLDAARAAGDKQEVARLKTMKSELERELEGIQSAVSSVNMSEEEMYEFAALEDKYSELRDIMDNWTATNQNLLRVWRQVGLLSEGRYQRLAAIKDYVPWNRIMNDEDDVHSPLQSTTRTMTNIGTEKLFRRGKPISVVDFVAKDGQQTFKVQPSSAVEVEVNGEIIPSNMVRGTPDGTIEVMVPIHEGDVVVIKTNREIENIIDNMTRNTMRMTMNAIRQFAAQRIVREYASRNHEGKIIQFKSPDKEKGRFTFIQNGRRTVVEISDPLLAEAIFGMEQIGLEMFKPLAMVANITRRAITLSGAFQVKQVFKDAPQAAFIAGVKNPFALVGGAWKGFVTSLTNTDPVVDILRKAGIGGFHSPARTPEAEIKRRIGIMNRNVYQFTIKALDHIGDSSDMAQRVAIYKRVMAETGDEAQALYQAANVINFMRHGSSGVAQVLVRTVPFMGAYLNSTDVLMTTLIGGGLKGMSRKKALARLGITGSILATSTILYAMLAGGDPEYDELDDQTKLKNYIIPGTKIMLPANTGAAFIYKALPELIYNAFIEEATKDKYDARRVKVALSKAAADMLLGPEPVPSGIKQVAEVALDYNFFTGRPITPQRVAGLEKSEQYIGSTSELAKKLGNDVLSPIQIDHLLRGILGTTGAVIGWISNSIGAIANVRPEPEERETPIKGAFLRPDIPRGREDLFYDLRSETQTKYKTWQTMLNRGKDKEANEYIKKHGDVAFMNDYSEEVSKDLQEMGQLIDMAENFVDKNYTAAQRRKDITEYKRIKNEILDSVKDIRMEAFGKAKLLSDAEKKKYKKMLDDMMDRAKQVRQ